MKRDRAWNIVIFTVAGFKIAVFGPSWPMIFVALANLRLRPYTPRMQKSQLWVFSAALLCVSACFAQSTAPNSSASGASKTQDQRVLGINIPNYLTVDGLDTKAPPLKSAGKFALAGKSFFNPYTFLETSAQAGLEQAINDHEGYGQGAEGYGKRYGADIANAFTGEIFGVGVYPSLLHTDPRYYRMMQGNVFRRGIYAISRVFVTRTDSGRQVFNASEMLASATTGGIATAYYPDNERNAADFASRVGVQVGFDAAFDVVKEFWPDVRDHLFNRHKH